MNRRELLRRAPALPLAAVAIAKGVEVAAPKVVHGELAIAALQAKIISAESAFEQWGFSVSNTPSIFPVRWNDVFLDELAVQRRLLER